MTDFEALFRDMAGHLHEHENVVFRSLREAPRTERTIYERRKIEATVLIVCRCGWRDRAKSEEAAFELWEDHRYAASMESARRPRIEERTS